MCEKDFYATVYITDCLKAIYKALGGDIEMRYYDIINDKEVDAEEEEARSEEIIQTIKYKLHKISEE